MPAVARQVRQVVLEGLVRLAVHGQTVVVRKRTAASAQKVTSSPAGIRSRASAVGFSPRQVAGDQAAVGEADLGHGIAGARVGQAPPPPAGVLPAGAQDGDVQEAAGHGAQ